MRFRCLLHDHDLGKRLHEFVSLGAEGAEDLELSLEGRMLGEKSSFVRLGSL
mgnify:CR=1 FL=1